MKALGIVRKMDELGRVVIPMEVRRVNGWAPGTPIEMFSTKEGLLIKKFASDTEKQGAIEELKIVLHVTASPVTKERIQKAIDYIEKQ